MEVSITLKRRTGIRLQVAKLRASRAHYRLFRKQEMGRLAALYWAYRLWRIR